MNQHHNVVHQVQETSLDTNKWVVDKLLDDLRIYLKPMIKGLELSEGFQRHYLAKFYFQSLIYNYYLSGEISFKKFISKTNVSDHKSYNIPRGFYTSVIKQVVDDSKKLGITNKATPLGDIHFEGGTKYLIDKRIRFRDYPDYYNIVDKIVSEINSDLKVSFPIHESHKDGTIVRAFIEVDSIATSKEQIENYYLNLGRIIPILLLLRAIDVYSENILIQLPNPIFFDLECIFAPNHKANPNYGIMHTGIVKTVQGNDVSVLTGGINPINSYLMPRLSGTIKEPHIEWKYKSNLIADNLITLNGKLIHPKEFSYQILHGYSESHKRIILRINEIIEIAQSTKTYVRYINRPTSFYSSRIQKYLFPNIYIENKALEFMHSETKKVENMYHLSRIDEITQYESIAMSKGLIPIFYNEIHSKDIITPNGSIIARHNTNPFQTWIESLTNIDQRLIDQMKILESALFQTH